MVSQSLRATGHRVASLDILLGEECSGKQNPMDLATPSGMASLGRNVHVLPVITHSRTVVKRTNLHEASSCDGSQWEIGLVSGGYGPGLQFLFRDECCRAQTMCTMARRGYNY